MVHVEPSHWDRWLAGSVDDALALLRPAPAEVFDQTDRLRTDAALAALEGP